VIEKIHETDSTIDPADLYTLPIDGQLYNFFYCIGEPEQCELPEHNAWYLYEALISILSFSTVIYIYSKTAWL